ncbi:MAG: hypothetical protein ACD_17C00377G0002 [uncultured bacterium]|nr:MAG: hypothetical protein ACD_17C00377G0002 [uncultured bacterium]
MAKIDNRFLRFLLLFSLFLQQQPLYGVTRRTPPLDAERLHKLASIGAHVIYQPSSMPKRELPPVTHWENGDLFLKNFHPRTPLFQKWMAYCHILPVNLVRFETAAWLKESCHRAEAPP